MQTGGEKLNGILLRDQSLFVAQKIEFRATAGTRIDEGGKVSGNIVGISPGREGKNEGDLQRDLSCPDEFSLSPWLTVNRDIATGSNCIRERLTIASKSRGPRCCARKQ